MNYKLSDFKPGQKAYIELTGNYGRGLSREDLIKECTVESVGKKYVKAAGIKFKEHSGSYDGLVEHTEYCVNHVLYPNRQALDDKLEKEDLVVTLKSVFTGTIRCQADTFSLEKLRKINKVINSEE